MPIFTEELDLGAIYDFWISKKAPFGQPFPQKEHQHPSPSNYGDDPWRDVAPKTAQNDSRRYYYWFSMDLRPILNTFYFHYLFCYSSSSFFVCVRGGGSQCHPSVQHDVMLASYNIPPPSPSPVGTNRFPLLLPGGHQLVFLISFLLISIGFWSDGDLGRPEHHIWCHMTAAWHMYDFGGAGQCHKSCHMTSLYFMWWLWGRWSMSYMMSYDVMVMSCEMSYDMYQCHKSCHMTS